MKVFVVPVGSQLISLSSGLKKRCRPAGDKLLTQLHVNKK